jgi:hypothetical protein
MADKESLTGIEQGVQIEERTKHAMENYFGWLQNTMSTLPWSNTNLNRILLSNATQNVTATFAFITNLAKPMVSKKSSKFRPSLWGRK